MHLPNRADIVIVDSHSADRDFWQSAKGPYAATIAVKTGGSVILVSPNPEGVASNHANVLEIGYRPQAELVDLVQQGGVDDLVGIAVLADVAQIVDHADCIMVSPGVKPEEARRLGFRYAAQRGRSARAGARAPGAARLDRGAALRRPRAADRG